MVWIGGWVIEPRVLVEAGKHTAPHHHVFREADTANVYMVGGIFHLSPLCPFSRGRYSCTGNRWVCKDLDLLGGWFRVGAIFSAIIHREQPPGRERAAISGILSNLWDHIVLRAQIWGTTPTSIFRFWLIKIWSMFGGDPSFQINRRVHLFYPFRADISRFGH